LGRRIIRYLRKYLVTGVLIMAPLAIVIYVLYWVFSSVDDMAQPAIEAVAGQKIPGLGFAIFLVLIYLVGIIASNYLGKRIVRFLESLITRVPAFRQIYAGAKQVVEGLTGSGLNKAAFREVVFVEFPRKGMMTMAFLTNVTTDESGQKLYVIYIPTPPMPTGGFFEMVTEDKIIHTDVSIDDGLKTIISCGIILPAEETMPGLLRRP